MRRGFHHALNLECKADRRRLESVACLAPRAAVTNSEGPGKSGWVFVSWFPAKRVFASGGGNRGLRRLLALYFFLEQ